MIATWLTELSLDRINRALLEEGGPGKGASTAGQLTQELRDFLQQRVDILDVKTTITLLASYGRLEDLMHYATCRQVGVCGPPPPSLPPPFHPPDIFMTVRQRWGDVWKITIILVTLPWKSGGPHA